jgi:CTP:molybdopterin cytidylyltransferase MocA
VFPAQLSRKIEVSLGSSYPEVKAEPYFRENRAITAVYRPAWAFRDSAADKLSRNVCRNGDTPKIDRGPTAYRGLGRASPSVCRIACTECGGRLRSWPRFYNMRDVATLITAVVLAAGRSTRMGRAKAMLPLHGETFLTHIIRTFRDAGVTDVVVVLGHEADAIAQTVQSSGLLARVVINSNYDRGQLSSLLAGLDAADQPGVAAILMTLVDVPLVSASTIRAVLDRYEKTRASIVRPVNGSRHGHPILIDRILFPALRAAGDATGAKPIVRANASTEGDVPVDDPGAFCDIDTMDDYARFIGDDAVGRGPGPSPDW